METTIAESGERPAIEAEDHTRRVIYHSPQKPGYTCWTGAWSMPDGNLMVSFTQATGAIGGQPKAPQKIIHKLSWYPKHDMTGLDLRNVHLRLSDNGKMWKKVSEDSFKSPMNGVTGEAEVALPNGNVICGVWRYYLLYNRELPKTGYLQRSLDGTQTWGKPETLLDPKMYSAWPKRLRMLKDGRLIALGGFARVPANSLTRREYNKVFGPLLLVSADAGKTWSEPIEVLPKEHRANWGGEEFDVAELTSGNLLCVFRRINSADSKGREVRWQGILKKNGKTWIPGKVGPSPLPHSGHPELLATRERVVLHIATTGVSWTADEGESWHQLNIPGTTYYPRSVQAGNGTIHVFGHIGGDNSYGSVDQAIVMDSFRLVAKERPPEEQSTTRFSEHLIADKYAYAYGIAAADFDRNGDLDLTSADYTPHNMLYLFENDSRGKFKRHFIQKDDPERLERHMIGDVDGDGDLDVVIVKNLRGHLLWFENSGTPTDGNLWRRHVITTKLPGAYDVALADFDKDGDLDVATSSWVLGNQFAWFENNGTPAEGEWEKHIIEKDAAETRTMRAADFDGDGDVDLLGTVRQASEVVWYENRHSAGNVSWTKHLIDDKSVCPAHGNPADMDGDGDLDVVMALGFYFRPGSKDLKASQAREDNQIVWYENNGLSSGPWAKHIIGAQFDDAFEAVAGDLDGDIDVVTTSWRNPGRVSWFENSGDPKGSWTCHLLKENWRSANQVIIADLNGDGRPDIAACAEHGSYELGWWRNEGRSVK
jgi:hypothetical protein